MENEIDVEEALGAFEETAKETPAEEQPNDGDTRIDFTQFYVEPHKKVSRDVTENDLDEMVKEAHILYNLCYTTHGIHHGAFAVAHPQINDKDPMRFFVTAEKEIIINPEIIRHTNTTVKSKEGCTSFPGLYPIDVDRWNKCEVRYQTLLDDGKISEIITENLTGRRAKIFQHEIGHMDGHYIFDKAV